MSSCDWSFPHENGFRGNKRKAVMTYTDIPLDVRTRIADRVDAAKGWDDVAEIDHKGIRGKLGTYVDLRQMFFGINSRCETVTRPMWSKDRVEVGLIYTEVGHTVVVWTVCGNVSRVTLVPFNGAKLALPVEAVPQPVPPAPVDLSLLSQSMGRAGIRPPGLRAPVPRPAPAVTPNKVPEVGSLQLIAVALPLAWVFSRRSRNAHQV